jgi:hypothetical protein
MKGFALCVASTLATLAIGSPDITDGGNLRALHDTYSADITILAAAGVVFGAPTFEYGDSGCGIGNKDCSCTLVNDSTILMHGIGTSWATSSLNFACGFLVNNFAYCKLHLDMFNSYEGRNSATWSCLEPYASNFTIFGNEVPTQDLRIAQTMGVYKSM